ncbi:hypothetical protein V5O48_014950 [Marasmius crinis-equi]|uniref:Uncharacterized protein n=1 Tax=Marasmius crinis-equi TaxID=585013 RepID=A0ABR3EVY2_9AGAR
MESPTPEMDHEATKNDNPLSSTQTPPQTAPDVTRSPPDPLVNASSSSEKPAPQSNSSGSTSQAPSKSTANDLTAAGSNTGEQEDDIEGDDSDESDTEAPKFKRGGPGNPGTWKPEQVKYMEKHLPRYLSLRTTKSKTDFFNEFMPNFLLKFPKEKYPPPEPSMVAQQFVPLPEADVNAMQSEDKKAYNKRLKRALRSEDERLLDRTKGWFSGRQQRKNAKTSNPFKPHLKKLYVNRKDTPKKTSLAQFVMKHEDYKEEVVEKSEETGSHDRLHNRVKAAQSILDELDEDAIQQLEAEAEEQLRQQKEIYAGIGSEATDGKVLNMERELELAACRRNLTSFAQPLLDFIREHTGMVCFFQAGYERDDPSEGHDFEIVSLSSVPEGSIRLPEFNIPFFAQFGREFAKWVRAIKQHQIEAGFEYPAAADIAKAGPARKKDKGKGKATPPPLPASRSKSVPQQVVSTSSAATPSAKRSKSSIPSAKSREASVSSPQPLPQPPSTDGMSIPEKQAAYREWHRELAEAMGLKEDVRNLFAGKERKERVGEDDEDYEDEEGAGDDQGSREAVRRTLRPRKPVEGSDFGTVDETEHEDKDNNDNNVKNDRTTSRDVPADKPGATDPVVNDALSVHSNDSSVPQPVPVVGEANNHVPENSQITSAPLASLSADDSAADKISPSSTDELAADKVFPSPAANNCAEDAVMSLGNRVDNPAPTDSVVMDVLDNPLVDSGGDDIGMDVSPIPNIPSPNAALFDAIEVPTVDTYPPESLKNGSFVREYATLLLKSDGMTLPPFWFPLVHKWIELEGRWDAVDLEPEKLPTGSRPPAFPAWFQAGRMKRPKGRVTPELVQLPSFRNEWWGWYDSINPAWRLRDGNVVLPGGDPGDRAWEMLECSGKDGFALLLIGLRWWFDRGGWDDKVGLGHWEHAVKGLYETMMHLHKSCDFYEANQPHLEDESGNQVPPSAGTTSAQGRVRKAPDSLICDGADSHRAKRRA